MKKDRRHQLSQNSLAKWLEKNIEAVKPHSSLLSKVVIGLLLIVLVYFAWQYLNKGNRVNFSQDLAAAVLLDTDDPTQLAPMLLKYPKGDENAHFQILIGELSLRNAGFQMMTQREEGKESVKKAQESFLAARKTAKSPELLDRCRWGMAKTHEILASVQEGNDLEEAKKLYEQIAADEKSVYRQLAKEQLGVLNLSWVPVFLASSIKTEQKTDLLPNFDPTIPEPGTSPDSSIEQRLNPSSEEAAHPEAATAVTEDTTDSESSNK